MHISVPITAIMAVTLVIYCLIKSIGIHIKFTVLLLCGFIGLFLGLFLPKLLIPQLSFSGTIFSVLLFMLLLSVALTWFFGIQKEEISAAFDIYTDTLPHESPIALEIARPYKTEDVYMLTQEYQEQNIRKESRVAAKAWPLEDFRTQICPEPAYWSSEQKIYDDVEQIAVGQNEQTYNDVHLKFPTKPDAGSAFGQQYDETLFLSYLYEIPENADGEKLIRAITQEFYYQEGLYGKELFIGKEADMPDNDVAGGVMESSQDFTIMKKVIIADKHCDTVYEAPIAFTEQENGPGSQDGYVSGAEISVLTQAVQTDSDLLHNTEDGCIEDCLHKEQEIDSNLGMVRKLAKEAGDRADMLQVAFTRQMPKSDSLEDLLDFAFIQKENHNYDDALFAFTMAYEIYPQNKLNYLLSIEIADIYKQLGQYDLAINSLCYGMEKTTQDVIKQEFISNIAYMRIIKNVLISKQLSLLPYSEIPAKVKEEIEVEFHEWEELS